MTPDFREADSLPSWVLLLALPYSLPCPPILMGAPRKAAGQRQGGRQVQS